MEATASVAAHPHPIAAAGAIAAAAAEGLMLVRENSGLGFRYVYISDRKYKVKLNRSGGRRYLGCFHTPEKAALRVARWLRDRASADETAPAQPAQPAAKRAAEAPPRRRSQRQPQRV